MISDGVDRIILEEGRGTGLNRNTDLKRSRLGLTKQKKPLAKSVGPRPLHNTIALCSIIVLLAIFSILFSTSSRANTANVCRVEPQGMPERFNGRTPCTVNKQFDVAATKSLNAHLSCSRLIRKREAARQNYKAVMEAGTCYINDLNDSLFSGFGSQTRSYQFIRSMYGKQAELEKTILGNLRKDLEAMRNAIQAAAGTSNKQTTYLQSLQGKEAKLKEEIQSLNHAISGPLAGTSQARVAAAQVAEKQGFLADTQGKITITKSALGEFGQNSKQTQQMIKALGTVRIHHQAMLARAIRNRNEMEVRINGTTSSGHPGKTATQAVSVNDMWIPPTSSANSHPFDSSGMVFSTTTATASNNSSAKESTDGSNDAHMPTDNPTMDFYFSGDDFYIHEQHSAPEAIDYKNEGLNQLAAMNTPSATDDIASMGDPRLGGLDRHDSVVNFADADVTIDDATINSATIDDNARAATKLAKPEQLKAEITATRARNMQGMAARRISMLANKIDTGKLNFSGISQFEPGITLAQAGGSWDHNEFDTGTDYSTASRILGYEGSDEMELTDEEELTAAEKEAELLAEKETEIENMLEAEGDDLLREELGLMSMSMSGLGIPVLPYGLDVMVAEEESFFLAPNVEENVEAINTADVVVINDAEIEIDTIAIDDDLVSSILSRVFGFDAEDSDTLKEEKRAPATVEKPNNVELPEKPSGIQVKDDEHKLDIRVRVDDLAYIR